MACTRVENGPHPCGLCRRKFHKRSQLLSHYTMLHTKVYKCRHCGSTALHHKSTVKTRHNYEVLDPATFPYNCHHCDRIFLYNSNLRKHLRQRHTNSRSYPCASCGRGLDFHVQRIHEGKRSYMCDQCGQAFFTEFELRNHSVTHGAVKQYQCPICDYATHVKATFQDHLRQHTGVRDIPCPQCGKLFITRRNLSNHMKRVHAPKMQCGLCAYKAAETTQLRLHMRLVHASYKVKPYKCAHCSFTCTLPGNCRKHILQRHPHQELKVIKLSKEQLAEREAAETGQSGGSPASLPPAKS
ncbi:hypothetical protein CAPTEDRAFT_91112 [Capitella teleta]|uniref:C2H2-type domain-containing protein n=1 Tax=Capitella teleta TaxID=283909 RepID=R7TLR4_CAPTE|nr:hypothetical protein CAPTEDRAFT_91112 [Capitella teleta]|eukprot:ELT92491.1 hypothetical protein CAPTEDRAFT_91112 [Capitella teleta]